ncbi:protein MAIN-LIKE 1-like [Vicia villosa]|uniref:protein MAIN-LIKE 1-like n=1 Tax=Vicia villosa TaxID=3911 RepID=UPI00273B547D|nr:protein MAIN-LIKE 1-like [Vicia villosa]
MDDGEGSSQTPSACRRCRVASSTPVSPPADAGSPVPPLDVIDMLHDKADLHEAPMGYPGDPSDLSLLKGYADHTARHVWDGEGRDPQKFYNHGRKIVSLVQPTEPWFYDVLADSGLKDLCQIGYSTIHNGMVMAFVDRWHPETSSFHLPHGEITITLDDIACLLHIPIRGTLLGHVRHSAICGHELLIHRLCLPEGWILQHFPMIIGWGKVPTYIKVMPRASAFIPLRGNQVSDPYGHSLDRMVA